MTPEFGKGDFGGVWLSPDKSIAAQYSPKIWQYILSERVSLLNHASREARSIEKEFVDLYPDLEDEVNQDGDFLELWMFPPQEFVNIITNHGYDGFINGSDYFIINTEKLKEIKN